MAYEEIRKMKKSPLKQIVVNGRAYRQVFQDFERNLSAVEDLEGTAWGNLSYIESGTKRIPLRVVEIKYALRDQIGLRCKVEDWVLPPVEEIIAEGIIEAEKRNPGFRDLNLNGILILDEAHFKERVYEPKGSGRPKIRIYNDFELALCRYEERLEPTAPGAYQWQTLCIPRGNINLRG